MIYMQAQFFNHFKNFEFHITNKFPMVLASNVCAISYRMACADCSKRIVRIGGGESRVDTIHPQGGISKGDNTVITMVFSIMNSSKSIFLYIPIMPK